MSFAASIFLLVYGGGEEDDNEDGVDAIEDAGEDDDDESLSGVGGGVENDLPTIPTVTDVATSLVVLSVSGNGVIFCIMTKFVVVCCE